jgi:hypothetical protein
MYFVCVSIPNFKAFLTLLSFTEGQHMDRKFDISVVVSAFLLAGTHLFFFVVSVIYLKMLFHSYSDPFLLPLPYILLHVSVTIACYYYCALSCVVRFYLIWGYEWYIYMDYNVWILSMSAQYSWSHKGSCKIFMLLKIVGIKKLYFVYIYCD